MSRSIFFDVDETLIEWETDSVDKERLYGLINHGLPDFIVIDNHKFRVNKPHVCRLKQHYENGDDVTVWSAGGRSWARRVIKALDLMDYVDNILTKPDFYYDDEDLSTFRARRMFLDADTGKFKRDGEDHDKGTKTTDKEREDKDSV